TASPASAAANKFRHTRDITLAQFTDGTPKEAAAQQIPHEARLVNLEGTEADINAGPHAESRDVTVAQIKNNGVPAAPVTRDVTLAQISDKADGVNEDAEDAPAQAQAAPASVPATAQPAGVATGASPKDAATIPQQATQKGTQTKSDTLSKAHPNARAFSVTAIEASENETDDDQSASSSAQPEARAVISVLHNTDNSQGDISSKRALTVSGDQNGNTVSTDLDNKKGAKYSANGSTPSSSGDDDDSTAEDDNSADDTAVQDDPSTDDGSDDATDPADPSAPNKRGNNKAGISTGANRQGRVIVATAGNGGNAVSGNGGDASGFAFDNSRNGYVPSSRPFRYVKPKFTKGGNKSKANTKSNGSHHFKVKGRKSTGSKNKSSGKLTSTHTSTSGSSNPIIEIDLSLLRQLIGQDRLDQLATGEKGVNDELVAAPSKKYSVSRPHGSVTGYGQGSASGSAHIAGSGNGGDASSGPAIAGNGGNVVINQGVAASPFPLALLVFGSALVTLLSLFASSSPRLPPFQSL
ncbi:hypothetical protein CF326_g6901, partial [Tilletia indica]